ncbi:M15 family metallopeptidase [Kordiimonas aquimaris]|uniref:M15 family metallopeptidase n=1 Tax=Kordiimonas aquimaris TaxID=707591 RepID=UPI0021CECEAF|nr:M15 family metallopeptidase [Kordiimonas aquimaris]
MHHDFVDIKTIVPNVVVEPRYAGADNFMGMPVKGYNAHKVIVSRPVAMALQQVQAELSEQGLALKIYDGYRPQQAVDHFMRWISDAGDQKNKGKFYPNVAKSELVQRGYIAEKSGHSRGGSVDVTLVRVDHGTAIELDMGSPWDLFDTVSHADATNLPMNALVNRNLLKEVMVRNGFKPYSEEWWHFTLDPEPYPDTYFNFVIE